MLQRRATTWAVLRSFSALLCVIGALLASYGQANAHPLGNFTVNTFSQLELRDEQVSISYIVDMAEIAALQEILIAVDTDRDEQASPAELLVYSQAQAELLRDGLDLHINQQRQDLLIESAYALLEPGQSGLNTMRIEVRYRAPLPAAATWNISYRDNNYADRIGWREIIAVPSTTFSFTSSDVSATSISQALRLYPEELVSQPLQISSASLVAERSSATVSSAESAEANLVPAGSLSTSGSPSAPRSNDPAEQLVAVLRGEFGPQAFLAALALAFALGASHALAPGHGKTIVAAYLVGSRGTMLHAILLGLTTTITHTLGVFALGLVTLLLAEYILPEQLYPWLSLASGLMVLLLGLALLRSRWQHWQQHAHTGGEELHDHGFGMHRHAPANTNLGGLLALGVSGGLIPCPSALVLMLGAISLGQIGLGLLLVTIFSLGLAAVLTAIGIALVRARQFFERLPQRGRALRALPVLSAFLVAGVGLAMTFQAFSQLLA